MFLGNQFVLFVKLGGAISSNDGKCHLNVNGTYTEGHVQVKFNLICVFWIRQKKYNVILYVFYFRIIRRFHKCLI